MRRRVWLIALAVQAALTSGRWGCSARDGCRWACAGSGSG